MKGIHSLSILALAAISKAQSAPEFPVQVDASLDTRFEDTSTIVSPAGLTLSRNDVLTAPVLAGPTDVNSFQDYMVFIIDQDVTSPSDPNTRVQFIHWYQPNLEGASDVLSDGGSSVENATSSSPLSYVPPSPPAGDKAHSYTVLMYNQPEGFDCPDAYKQFFQDKSDFSNRMNFDIAGFASAAGLGQPVSANWFKVQNTDAAPSSSSTTSSSTTTTTSTSSPSTEISTSTTTSSESSTTMSTESPTTTDIATSTTVEITSASVDSVTTEAVPSTSTVVVGPSGFATTPTPSDSASASASASISLGTSGNGAGAVDVRESRAGMTLAFVVALAAAAVWA